MWRQKILREVWGGLVSFVPKSQDMWRRRKKERELFGAVPIVVHSFFHFSEERSHEKRPRIKNKTCQFYHKTLNFVGPTDIKHVGFYSVLVVWVTPSYSKMHTTTRSVSDPEGCLCLPFQSRYLLLEEVSSYSNLSKPIPLWCQRHCWSRKQSPCQLRSPGRITLLSEIGLLQTVGLVGGDGLGFQT